MQTILVLSERNRQAKRMVVLDALPSKSVPVEKLLKKIQVSR